MSRTTLTPEETASYARVLTPFLSQAKSVSTIVNPKVLPIVLAPQTIDCVLVSSLTTSNVVQEDLVLLRLTTKKNELMVVPGTICERTHARTHTHTHTRTALTWCAAQQTQNKSTLWLQSRLWTTATRETHFLA
jgi:hypothetical protein